MRNPADPSLRMEYSRRCARVLIGCVFPVVVTLPARAQVDPSSPATLAAEMDSIIDHHLSIWYPRVIDEEHGGFLSRFDYRWELDGSRDKMIVTRARHVWTTATSRKRSPSTVACSITAAMRSRSSET